MFGNHLIQCVQNKLKKLKVKKEAEDEISAATEALWAEGQNLAAQGRDNANMVEGSCSDHHHESVHSNGNWASGEELDGDEDGRKAYEFDSSDLEGGTLSTSPEFIIAVLAAIAWRYPLCWK
jgi:hypothetical protein